MGDKISNVTMEEFIPTLETPLAVIIVILTIINFLFGSIVQLKVFKLLGRKSDRAINRIIYFQQVNKYPYQF